MSGHARAGGQDIVSAPEGAQPAPPLAGQQIVCVGFSDWRAELLTNQHHLLSRAAASNRILFVESLGLRRPQLAARDMRRILRRLSRAASPLREIDGVHVLSPLVLPLHSNATVRRLNAALLRRYVRHALARLGMREPMLLSFVPQAEVLLETVRPSKVLYYIDDDHAAKKGIDAASFLAAEERFARHADVVLASAPAILERMRVLNPNAHYAPNVADTRMFSSALQPGALDTELAGHARPRIVFVGAVRASTVDVPLVVGMAERRPHWSFLFVGPVGTGDPRTNVDALRSLPNVHLLGPRPYERLPDVLRGADAAIVPYRLDNEMGSVFPMKTYEYLAAGLPVVSTPLPTLADVQDVVTASGAEEFIAALERQLEADSPAERERRSQDAQAHSWESRLQQIAEVLASLDASGPSR